MEDYLYFALHGCILAREFENSPPTQPDEFFKSCQTIAEAFTRAMNCLNSRNPATALLRLPDVNGEQPDFAGIQLESSRAMDHVVHSNGVDLLVQLGGCSQSPETAVAEPSVSGAAGFPTLPGLKKRRGSYEKRTIRVPAPPIGNVDSMPDDGYTWRKYGQKDILGSTFPR
ncbi:hypothetical protein EJ110_NYTH47908 [Nymphaea thermarum]|nr:hypothetical protein EJ110_NYTH47908 [Nymphaea thermarum]